MQEPSANPASVEALLGHLSLGDFRVVPCQPAEGCDADVVVRIPQHLQHDALNAFVDALAALAERGVPVASVDRNALSFLAFAPGQRGARLRFVPITPPQSQGKKPRTYCLVAQDLRGIRYVVRRGLSDEQAKSVSLGTFTESGKTLYTVRERQNKRDSEAHPAERFLLVAACHACGHVAKRHDPAGGCQDCALEDMDFLPTADVPASDACTRRRDMVMLDALADFSAEGFSVTHAVLLTPKFVREDAVLKREPSGFGFYVTRRRPDDPPAGSNLAAALLDGVGP